MTDHETNVNPTGPQQNHSRAVEAAINRGVTEMLRDCQVRARAHFEMAGRWRSLNLFLGIPSTLFAAVSGVGGAAELFGDHSAIVAGLLALTVAALTGVSTFLNPGDRASANNAASSQYAALERRMMILRDVELALTHSSVDEKQKGLIEELREMTEKLTAVQQSSPQLSRSAYSGAAAHLGDSEISCE